MNDADHCLKYTFAQNRDRDINELEGLIRGIAVDGRIVAQEAECLERWCSQGRNWPHGNLFREARARIREAVADGILDDEERADILHFCKRLRSPSPFYSVATADMQRLHGLLGGIGADGIVNEEELRGLSEWMEGAEHLKGTWPYDEVESLVTKVLSDGRIDEEEHRFLVAFTWEFLQSANTLVLQAPFEENLVRHGICAVQPEVSFEGKLFCVTGSSPRAFRSQIEFVVTQLGGKPPSTSCEGPGLLDCRHGAKPLMGVLLLRPESRGGDGAPQSRCAAHHRSRERLLGCGRGSRSSTAEGRRLVVEAPRREARVDKDRRPEVSALVREVVEARLAANRRKQIACAESRQV